MVLLLAVRLLLMVCFVRALGVGVRWFRPAAHIFYVGLMIAVAAVRPGFVVRSKAAKASERPTGFCTSPWGRTRVCADWRSLARTLYVVFMQGIPVEEVMLVVEHASAVEERVLERPPRAWPICAARVSSLPRSRILFVSCVSVGV